MKKGQLVAQIFNKELDALGGFCTKKEKEFLLIAAQLTAESLLETFAIGEGKTMRLVAAKTAAPGFSQN